MRNIFFTIGSVAVVLLLVSLPVSAHHSFAAEFDSEQPVELHGTVVEVDWVNPHAWIYITVEGNDGSAAQWATELGSPNLLMRNGWRSDSLKPGDEVVITGHRARDGSLLASARTVRLADGERIFNAGSSGEEQ
jgi:hypothetical protein